MKSIWRQSLAAAAILAMSSAPGYALVVYDNLSTTPTLGYSELDENAPVFGDALNLIQGGTLTRVGLSLFNSLSGVDTGLIQKGATLISFYNNTLPYAGGPLSNPLLGTATVSWDLTGLAGGGLPAGAFVTQLFDVSGLGITLPEHILVTQQFTQTQGTATHNGVVLLSDPTVGSSPDNVYLKSTATAEGLYTFQDNPGQFAYYIEVESSEVVPEPKALSLLCLGLFLIWTFRNRAPNYHRANFSSR